MSVRRLACLGLVGLVGGACLVGSVPRAARAQDAAFQAFFFDACVNPTGALATRCGETTGGLGNLSGDSESSLNPGQVLSAHDSTLDRAQARIRGLESLLEARRGDQPGAQEATRARELAEGVSLLVAGRGGWFERDASAGERGFDGSSAGVQLGVDWRVTDHAVVGGVFTYDRLDSEFDADAPGTNFTPFANEGERRSDAYIFTLFGAYEWEGFFIDAHTGAGPLDYEFERNVVFQESNRAIAQTSVNTRAEVDGVEYSTGGGIGYDADLGPASIGAYSRIRYVWNRIDGYTEKGGNGLAMRLPRETRSSLVSLVGVRGSAAIGTELGVVIPQARLEWEHEYQRDAISTSASYVLDANGNAFALRGDGPDRNYLNFGASITMVLPGGWLPFAAYEGVFAYEDWSRHRFTAGLRKELR